MSPLPGGHRATHSDSRNGSATTLMEPERLDFSTTRCLLPPAAFEKPLIIADRYFFFFGEMIMII
jgi:hypothetical protein